MLTLNKKNVKKELVQVKTHWCSDSYAVGYTHTDGFQWIFIPKGANPKTLPKDWQSTDRYYMGETPPYKGVEIPQQVETPRAKAYWEGYNEGYASSTWNNPNGKIGENPYGETTPLGEIWEIGVSNGCCDAMMDA